MAATVYSNIAFDSKHTHKKVVPLPKTVMYITDTAT
jgi:hypothetical protein